MEFAAEYCDDADLLAMVQFHDEPFALWRQVAATGRCSAERLAALRKSILDWNLFLAFSIIDGWTVGKDRQPLRWLFREAAGEVASRFTEDDIW